MSCSVGLKDIEDFTNELNDAPRKAKSEISNLKRKTKNNNNLTENKENEYEKEYIQNVPGTQKIYVKTFGCSHNMSDSEFMMGQLAEYGYTLVDSLNDADLILINSCTVKNPSQDAFIGLVNTVKKNKKHLVVAGCVPQGDRFIPEIEDISTIGVTQIDRVVEVVNETFKGNKVKLLGKKELPTLDLPKIRKNKYIEIVAINTGCLGACTYCKTVQARGKLGSYAPEALVERVKQAIGEGVKEIWLTSEDTGAYGRDINTNISVLLKELTKHLPEDVMMRIGMTNPPYMMEHLETIAEILKHPNVYEFLHVPVQSGNNVVLDNMNREYHIEEFEKVCDYMLKHVPGITLATDIICGFPGETDEQFKDTLKLVEKYKFPVLNISQFYPRPGTAAAKMKRVNTKDVKARSKEITKLFESYHCYDKLMNTAQKIWIRDKEHKKNSEEEFLLVGHTKSYVKVLIEGNEDLIGKSVWIKVNKTLKWHIEGTIISEPLNEKIPQSNIETQNKNITQKSTIQNSSKSFANFIMLLGLLFIVIAILMRFL